MTSEASGSAAAPLPTAPKRRRWLTVLLAILIFGAGAVSGAAVTMAAFVHRMQFVLHHPEGLPGRIVSRLERSLNLDEAQKPKVEAIVAKRQEAMMGLRREFEPHLMKEMDTLRAEVGDVLTPPQRERWERMFDSFRARWLPSLPPEDAKPQGDG